MNQEKFNSLIDSLVDSVKDYNLDDSFDHYDAIIQICENCNYYFEYYRAWQLVNFVRFEHFNVEGLGLFYEVEMEVKVNDHNTDDITLDDYMMTYAFNGSRCECDPYRSRQNMMTYAFNILKVATLKKYEEQVKADVEQEKDARLIAAAPEMYEMLKELESGIHLARARKGSKTIDKLREVLAKVEG